ncbi:type II toxin-antitoxin system VapC family toxin [Anabaena azotica]|uniref:type II toxin-antitoxin system VapC family toxin n=1 Tax=Anabaena azotica TaxID=197653 RepID=UPI001F55814E|nr:hypothetical protein [Anabaena azotica]
MRLMLDTHTFLWFIEGSLNLSDTAKNLIEDQRNQRFLSVASLWEMSILRFHPVGIRDRLLARRKAE